MSSGSLASASGGAAAGRKISSGLLTSTATKRAAASASQFTQASAEMDSGSYGSSLRRHCRSLSTAVEEGTGEGRRAAEPGQLRALARRLDGDAGLGEPEPHRPGRGLDLDERAVGADRGDFVAGARRRPVERRPPAKRGGLRAEKQERSLLVLVREPGGHRANQLGAGREEECAELGTRRLRHPGLHHYRVGTGRHEPLCAAHERMLEPGGLPAPKRLDPTLAL